LSEVVIDTVAELLGKPYVNRRIIIELVEDVLHYDADEFTPEMREPWEGLKAALVGNDFHSQLERYVGMELLEDKVQDGKTVDIAGPKIEALATEVVGNHALLDQELPWLVTDAAKNGYRFGYALGTQDTEFSRLPKLLDTQRMAGQQGSAYFLGGYFRAIFEKSHQEWEERLDECATDESLRIYVPQLTWRSGLTDRAALRVLALATTGAVAPHAFRMFAWGSVLKSVSTSVFDKWIEFLLRQNTREAAGIAVDLYHFYYFRPDSVAQPSKDITLALLTAQPFFTETDDRSLQREDYDWTEVATGFVAQEPAEGVPLAAKLLEHFGEKGTPLGGFHPQAAKVLTDITRRSPTEVWQIIAGYLGPPIDKRAFHMKNWLRDGALSLIPGTDVWKWIDANLEKRPWYAATFVPPVFPGETNRCSAREILVRYGSRADVRRNLASNFSTEGWCGPESSHHEGKLTWLKGLKADEQNQNVLTWIDEFIEAVERRVKRAQIEEERED
jgi:hypothetical protein